MNPEVKAMWLKALRSGEYKQTDSVLRDGDSFCCLGVLCDLHTKNTGKGGWIGDVYGSGEDSWRELPPESVIEWAGLREQNPSVTIQVKDEDDGFMKDANVALAELNDNGMTFEEIADIIEEVL